MFCIFFKQLVQNLASFGRIMVKEVLAFRLQALRAFTSSAQRSVERKMAKQVERVRIESIMEKLRLPFANISICLIKRVYGMPYTSLRILYGIRSIANS